MSSAQAATNPDEDVEMGISTYAGDEPGTTTPTPSKVGQGFLKPIPETTPMERVAGIFACAAVVTALMAMIIEGSTVVIIAGILSAVVGPFAYYQQTELTDIKALKETEEKMRMEVDRLTSENKRLAHNIDEMSESVQGLKDISDALEVITAQQGQSVTTFAAQVEEQRKILDGMQTNLAAKIIDNLLSLAFGADQNDNQIIDPQEAENLIRHIQSLSGVSVKADKFRDAISGQTADKVIDIIENLLKENLPEEEKMFIFTLQVN